MLLFAWKAAKVVRRHPAVLGLLASGRVNLTTVRLLAPHLTRDNHEGLFAEAAGKRKRQVQELLARRFPMPDVAASVRKLPAVGSPAAAAPGPLPAVSPSSLSSAPGAVTPPPEALIPPAPRPLVRTKYDSPASCRLTPAPISRMLSRPTKPEKIDWAR